MFKVHKTHDEWLVISGNRTICQCDFKEDAERIAELKQALSEISEMTLHRHTLNHAVQRAKEALGEHT